MNYRIGIIGLGYVGLPLAAAFATKYQVVGFDISGTRITELRNGTDQTLELNREELIEVIVSDAESFHTISNGLFCTSDKEYLRDCSIFIVTVPTPMDKHNRPDLTPLVKASETVGSVLKQGDIVIYESTVYPGVTEEECVPILEKVSGLVFNSIFSQAIVRKELTPEISSIR
jgi:UDP-N-acetyl-D-galactosamine dehydrogenase